MTILLILVLIGAILLLLFWLMELATGLNPEKIQSQLDEVMKSRRVETTIYELTHGQYRHFSRRQIFQRMKWIWQETHVLVRASNSLVSGLFLLQFWLFFAAVGVKTLILPNARDLRLLLGIELFFLCQKEMD